MHAATAPHCARGKGGQCTLRSNGKARNTYGLQEWSHWTDSVGHSKICDMICLYNSMQLLCQFRWLTRSEVVGVPADDCGAAAGNVGHSSLLMEVPAGSGEFFSPVEILLQRLLSFVGEDARDAVDAATHGVGSSAANVTEPPRERRRLSDCNDPLPAAAPDTAGSFPCRCFAASCFAASIFPCRGIPQVLPPKQDFLMESARCLEVPEAAETGVPSDAPQASTIIGDAGSVLVLDIPKNTSKGNTTNL
ncbi:hypothetical protein EMWEY_00003360 [Eimeria maxima]|uniref:Uncharacterized protein n=1 Tax=Eimeria maxima TaxID=5804 RepID=U6LX92_EIMMA|nr:hypothetical protein EMWEY_00003360 [Eimeria maxima]CDJ56542.1 hypothetical protein EMWEY_00003360 [Eimeria maxima]